MNKPPTMPEQPLAYTVEGDGKYVIPLTLLTVMILIGLVIFVIVGTASAWIFHAIFGVHGVLIWKITLFVTGFAYFSFIRPFRKARHG